MDILKLLEKKQAYWDSLLAKKEEQTREKHKWIQENRDKSIPELQEFYAGRSILITGGLGFLGKVLLEKILRSLPDIDKIYLIVRPKKNADPADRTSAVLKTDIFDLVRSQQPKILEKVVTIGGDVSCKGLGLSMEDRALLQKEVSVVIHGAASVRFDDPFKSAILLNTRGTREIVELSKGMPNLKAFVYLSTTYCNTNQPVSMEKVYPTPYDWRHIIKIAEETSTTEMQGLWQIIKGFQPNTYLFTKQLAEKVVDDARHDIPVIIIRPSVVVAATSEPFPYWSDNLYGPAGIGVGIMKGVLRGFHVDPNVNLKSIPVDSVGKMIIASAWIKGTNQTLHENPSETAVINATAEAVCQATYDDMFKTIPLLVPIIKPRSLRAPRIYATNSELYYYYKLFTSHILFALCVDTILKLAGQKPQLLKVARSIHSVNLALRYFLSQSFNNSTDMMWKLIAQTTDPNFQQDFNAKYLDTAIGTVNYAYKNVLKEKEAGPYHQTILEIIHFITHALKYALFLWLGWNLATTLAHRYLLHDVDPHSIH